MPVVRLKKGRERSVGNRHPWIFSGAIDKAPANLGPGDIVDVHDTAGKFLARGYYNEASQIRVRLLTWDPGEVIDSTFWAKRFKVAIARRRPLIDPATTTALRLIAAEADLLPGLIVDRYGDFLVIQALTAGMERVLAEIVPILQELTQPRGIYERSDEEARKLEGLPLRAGVLAGEAPPEQGIEILEHGVRFMVDSKSGHKTGFYLDQRDNRQTIARCARGRQVLNCFSYTGAFSVLAAQAGAAAVTSVDASGPALATAQQNFSLNGLATTAADFIKADVFELLRDYDRQGRRFDLIILDPPKFAHKITQINTACRGYKDLARLAFKLLADGGLLATFSCSGLISPELFQKVIFSAAVEAGVDAQVVQKLGQATDHPILLTFPESEYLKGLLCQVAR